MEERDLESLLAEEQYLKCRSRMSDFEYLRVSNFLKEARKLKSSEPYDLFKKLIFASSTIRHMSILMCGIFNAFFDTLEKQGANEETYNYYKEKLELWIMEYGTEITYFGVKIETYLNGTMGEVMNEVERTLAEGY